MTPSRWVTSADGTALAVYITGDAHGPTVVAVHGYPDNHTLWDGVVATMSARYRMVTFDVRGFGESDKPAERRAYLMDRLVEDLTAVIDEVSPDKPVHLLAHDWGSVHTWASVTDERLQSRIASYTSISGPSLDHVGVWIRGTARHPIASAKQLVESYYIGLFQVPGLAERFWRSGAGNRAMQRAAKIGRSSRAVPTAHTRTDAETMSGLNLYRANMLPRLSRPQPRRTDIPVQVIAPRRDIFVSTALQTQAPQPFVSDLRLRTVAGGHWVVSDRPDVIAALTSEFIDFVQGAPETRALAVASQRRPGRFGGQLVLVTGGGRGIGRTTALEFARAGADLILADVNDSAAKDVVAEIELLGVTAHAYHLDVSDAQAWESFAKQVREEHGVPDVIVNNAGIGMGGAFLNTSVADWEKILSVNLWGVIHGSRLFAEQMVERGQGGHIVNIASAAAYSPSKIYPAYATTKAAVLMLTECLRAELSTEGIGVTAICPGFIDTDISKTTVHVGVDSDTERRLRAHAVASYSRRNYTPERLARHAVRAVARNTAVAAITPESKLLRAISRYAPRLGRQVSKIDLNKL